MILDNHKLYITETESDCGLRKLHIIISVSCVLAVEAKSAQPKSELKNKVAKSNSIARAPAATSSRVSVLTNQVQPLSRESQALDLSSSTNQTPRTSSQSQRALQLDTFDSTDESFRQELEGELEKLNLNTSSPRTKERRDSL